MLHSLEISIDFFQYYGVKESPFLNFVFTPVGNKTATLNFEEFVIVVWDFLSQEIAIFAFNKFNEKKKKSLSFETIHQIISMIHGSDFNPQIESVIKSLDVGTDLISSADFVAYCKENKSLLAPIRRFQRHLRVQIIGEVYWRSMTDIRQIKLPDRTVLEIISRSEDEVDSDQIKITL